MAYPYGTSAVGSGFPLNFVCFGKQSVAVRMAFRCQPPPATVCIKKTQSINALHKYNSAKTALHTAAIPYATYR